MPGFKTIFGQKIKKSLNAHPFTKKTFKKITVIYLHYHPSDLISFNSEWRHPVCLLTVLAWLVWLKSVPILLQFYFGLSSLLKGENQRQYQVRKHTG